MSVPFLSAKDYRTVLYTYYLKCLCISMYLNTQRALQKVVCLSAISDFLWVMEPWMIFTSLHFSR